MAKEYYSKNVKNSLSARKKERDKFIKNCLRGAANPYAVSDLQNEIFISNVAMFKEHAGRIFPLVLELASNGNTLKAIIRDLRLIPLRGILDNYYDLRMAFYSARKIHHDRRADALELEFLIS